MLRIICSNKIATYNLSLKLHVYCVTILDKAVWLNRILMRCEVSALMAQHSKICWKVKIDYKVDHFKNKFWGKGLMHYALLIHYVMLSLYCV